MVCIIMQKNRDLSFDVFRGVAVIAVVAIHAAFKGFSVKAVSNEQWNFPFLIAYGQLLTFCVPAFFFISGYWASTTTLTSFEDYKTFLARRFSRILMPYFFWSVLWLGYTAIKENKFDVYQAVFQLVTGRASFPYYTYYFIIVIAQLYMITPILQYINRKSYGWALIIILNFLSLLALYLSRLKLAWHQPVTLPFYLWVIFYEIGLLTGKHIGKVFLLKRFRYLILSGILLSILVSEMEGFIILSRFNDPFFANAITKYSSFLYSFFVILGFLVLREYICHWPDFLVMLGRYSFVIYLMHMIVLNVVAKYVRNIDIIYLFQPLYQVIVVTATLLICLIFISAARKLFSKSFCQKALGF